MAAGGGRCVLADRQQSTRMGKVRRIGLLPVARRQTFATTHGDFADRGKKDALQGCDEVTCTQRQVAQWILLHQRQRLSQAGTPMV